MFFNEKPDKVTVRRNLNNPDFCSVVLCNDIKSVTKQDDNGERVEGFTADIITLVDVRYYDNLKELINKEFDVWVEAGIKQEFTRTKSDKQIIAELKKELEEKDGVIEDLIQVLIDNGVIY